MLDVNKVEDVTWIVSNPAKKLHVSVVAKTRITVLPVLQTVNTSAFIDLWEILLIPAHTVDNWHPTIWGCFTKVKGHKIRGWFLQKSPPWFPVAMHTASLHMPVFFSMHISPMLHIMRLSFCSISKARNTSQTRPFPCAMKINTEPRKTRPTLSMKKG